MRENKIDVKTIKHKMLNQHFDDPRHGPRTVWATRAIRFQKSPELDPRICSGHARAIGSNFCERKSVWEILSIARLSSVGVSVQLHG